MPNSCRTKRTKGLYFKPIDASSGMLYPPYAKHFLPKETSGTIMLLRCASSILKQAMPQPDQLQAAYSVRDCAPELFHFGSSWARTTPLSICGTNWRDSHCAK